MKTKELEKVKKAKTGHVNKNGVRLEPNEEKTYNYLAHFGFDIELIRPTNTKRTKNPDVLIFGTIWEVKTPISSNKNTIKNRFREASRQATKVIFDLRFIKRDAEGAKEQILKLFKSDGHVRRLIIIEKSGKVVDIIK